MYGAWFLTIERASFYLAATAGGTLSGAEERPDKR